MEVADVADWFNDVEIALDRIQSGGGWEIFEEDDSSSDIEVTMLCTGGIDGFLRTLEREAALDGNTGHKIVRLLLFAYFYEVPTIATVDGEEAEFVEIFKSLVPRCIACKQVFPSCADLVAFKVCQQCDAAAMSD